MKEPWATTLLPNLNKCAFPGPPQGPPGVKIPVQALTGTATTTIDGGSLPSHSSARPASSHTQPGPAVTSAAASTPAKVSYSSKSPSQVQINTEGAPATGLKPLDTGGVSTNDKTEDNPAVTLSANAPKASISSLDSPNEPSAFSEGSPTFSRSASKDHPTHVAQVGGHTIDLSPTDSHIIVIHGAKSSAIVPTDSPAHSRGPLPSAPIAEPDETMAPGGPALTISGTAISLGSSALLIGTSTIPLPDSESLPQPLTSVLNGHTYTGYPTIKTESGTTRAIFGPLATISGSTVYPASAPNALPSSFKNVGGEASKLGSSDTAVTVNGEVLHVKSSAVVINRVTVSKGAPAVTVSGTKVSLGTAQLVVGSSTVAYQPPATVPAITFNGKVIPIKASAVVINGATLTEGSPALTVSGTKLSLGTAELVTGSSTIPYQPLPTQTAVTLNHEPITLEPSAVVIDGVTLTEGAPALTVSGTEEISLGTGELVVGTDTLSFSNPAASTTEGLGAAIMAAFGAHGTATTTTTGDGAVGPTASSQPVATFTGGSSQGRRVSYGWVVGMTGSVAGWVCVLPTRRIGGGFIS